MGISRKPKKSKQPEVLLQPELASGQTYAVKVLVLDDGSCPVEAWYRKMRDVTGKHYIRNRIERIERGNLGNNRSIGNGVFEVKIDIGPGYRIYYALAATTVIVLLVGGDKSTQDDDAGKARGYWKEYKDGIEGHERDFR